MAKLQVFLCILSCFLVTQSAGQGIGVNYGLNGDNLPSPDKVMALLKTRKITKIRIFDPNPDVLKALKGSNIEVVVGVKGQDLQQLSTNPSNAETWVKTNIIPYAKSVKFRYITAGNEIIPGQFAQYVFGAIKNLEVGLKKNGLSIPVSLTVALSVLGTSYPPSSGAFTPAASKDLVPIVHYLADKGTPLLASVYPYFAYADNSAKINVDYALLNAKGPVVTDGNYKYDNLFDAMIDALHAALDKVGGQKVRVVVAETGWPSGGGNGASVQNAQTYNSKLIAHVSSRRGTPRRPNTPIEAYIFALFNENKKPAGVEQHWGLYNPGLTEVYHVDFP